MRTRYRTLALAALVPLVFAGVGCNLVKAKAAFKDGNASYKDEKYREAIKDYEKAVALKPNFAEAHFYLASANQNLYRPGKPGDDNRAHLDTAVEHYEKSLEVNAANTPERKQLRLNTLGALTTIYSDPPLQNFERALGYAEQIVKDDPNDTKNLYAMAGLYEKFNRVAEAEATYKKVAELNPSDVKVCGTLAGFYNKALWDEQGGVFVDGKSQGSPRSKFDIAIATLENCALLAPDDPSGYQKVATFYWDKAYRDPNLTDAQKTAYADKGIEAVNKALEINPAFWEAIIYKGLLYREKAKVAPPAERKKYLDDAQLFQKQAMDLRKEQQAETSGGAEGVPPEAAAAGK